MSVGVGVIGAGMMGADHVRTLTHGVDGAHVAAVADVDPARARGGRGQAGARAIADPHALIADPAVDAVVVASIDASHEEFVSPASGPASRCCARSRSPRPPTPACG